MRRALVGLATVLLACAQDPSSPLVEKPTKFVRDPLCPDPAFDGTFTGWDGTAADLHEYSDACGGKAVPTEFGTLYVNNDREGLVLYVLVDWGATTAAPGDPDRFEGVLLTVKSTLLELRLYGDRRLDVLCDGEACSTDQDEATTVGASPDPPDEDHDLLEVRLASAGIASRSEPFTSPWPPAGAYATLRPTPHPPVGGSPWPGCPRSPSLICSPVT